ncbi:glycosyltransferase family 4 protein [Thermodesulfobacteriota bacterium B35]
MGELLDILKNNPEIEMGVVTACPQFQDSRFKYQGVEYFIVHQKWARLRRQFFPVDNNPVYVKKCAAIADIFKPDIVHIHGTERFYGEMLCRGLLPCSVVFSLQGLMDAYSNWHNFFGKIPVLRILADNVSATLKGQGFLLGYLGTRKQAVRERRYLQQGRFFFGRTAWDRATVRYYNDHAKYYCVNEVLRTPFWSKKWRFDACTKHRIIFTNARQPRKGTELLLAAAKRLLPLYPGLKLVLIGSLGAGKYRKRLEEEIRTLQGAVELLGPQNAREIANELSKAHIFISASYIDNSPNSVAEAQLVGTPVIASYTGGVPSLVQDGQTGLLFPTGDVPLLVDAIIRIFEDDSLAQSLSQQARETAAKRHNPNSILAAQLKAYKDILSRTAGKYPQ